MPTIQNIDWYSAVADCTCGNSQYGFNCVCAWVRAHPGNREFSCEHCGLYAASAPRCSQCEETT